MSSQNLTLLSAHFTPVTQESVCFYLQDWVLLQPVAVSRYLVKPIQVCCKYVQMRCEGKFAGVFSNCLYPYSLDYCQGNDFGYFQRKRNRCSSSGLFWELISGHLATSLQINLMPIRGQSQENWRERWSLPHLLPMA